MSIFWQILEPFYEEIFSIFLREGDGRENTLFLVCFKAGCIKYIGKTLFTVIEKMRWTQNYTVYHTVLVITPVPFCLFLLKKRVTVSIWMTLNTQPVSPRYLTAHYGFHPCWIKDIFIKVDWHSFYTAMHVFHSISVLCLFKIFEIG